MNRLPDIIVLDFCIWLSERVKGNNSDDNSLLIDALSREKLNTCAEQYLHDRRFRDRSFSVRSLAESFLSSEEFKTLEKDPILLRHFWDFHPIVREMHPRNRHRYYFDSEASLRFALEETFHIYLIRNTDLMSEEVYQYDKISPCRLADSALYYLKSSIDRDTKESTILNLMVNTQNEVSDEIDFLEWILQREKTPSFESMPAEVFDELIEEYARNTGTGSKEIEKLKKDYYHTGWSVVFERIQRWFSLNGKHPQRSLADVMNRYLSKQAKYNCVILPLADPESKKQFRKLVTEEWDNLNDLSGDTLDIYYSETDIGKTGYDIAMRLQSLPDRLRNTAPCIILWKDTIEDAKAIPIERLNAKQIFAVIQTIVQQIAAEKDIITIIQEAEKTVKKQEALNCGATYNEFSGGKNVVVTGNTGNTLIIQGDDAEIGDITMKNTVNKDTCDFLQQLEEAICAIQNSNEIEAESKEQLVSIMADARQAETENSDEKRSMAKKAFGYVKGFLIKSAPVLISTLANLTKIASFFGLTV